VPDGSHQNNCIVCAIQLVLSLFSGVYFPDACLRYITHSATQPHVILPQLPRGDAPVHRGGRCGAGVPRERAERELRIRPHIASLRTARADRRSRCVVGGSYYLFCSIYFIVPVMCRVDCLQGSPLASNMSFPLLDLLRDDGWVAQQEFCRGTDLIIRIIGMPLL
jgi:hypothetical protein